MGKRTVCWVFTVLVAASVQASDSLNALDWSHRFGVRTVQTLAGNFDALVDFRAADFDGDGAFDFLYADDAGVWVCWGTCNGGVWDAELVLTKKGSIAQIAYEEAEFNSWYPPLLWLRITGEGAGDQLEGFRFEGRELTLFREITEPVSGALRCTGHGLIFGNGADNSLLLERNGAMVRLKDLGSAADDVDLEDVDGDGRLDLIVQVGDRLGVSFGEAPESFAAWNWLPTEEPVGGWDVQQDLHGNFGLLVGSRYDGGFDHWTWKEGAWHHTVIRTSDAGELINHHSPQWAGGALIYRAVQDVLSAITYDVERGEWNYHNLTELTTGSFVRVEDFNGDGVDDVVAFDPEERRLHVVRCHQAPETAQPVWSRLALEALEPMGEQDFDLPEPMRVEWLQGQTWRPERDWLVAESGIWSLGDHSSAVHRYHIPTLEPAVTSRSKVPCVDVQFLIYEPRAERPCLPLDMGREWHRVTYSRGPRGETAVAVDGQLCFDGYSEGLNFDHRMVQLGAAFGVKWVDHVAADIDEFVLMDGHLDAAAVLDYHVGTSVDPPLPLVGTVTLDGAEPRSARPSYEEVTWEGGAELVKTPWDQGLRFDGETGHAYVFLDVPEDAVTFDVRFKLNAMPEGQGNLVGLYGMFNLQTRVRHGVPVAPVAHSPSQFDLQEFEDTWGGHLVKYGGRVRRVLPNGEFMRVEQGQWELMGSEELPHGWSEVAPWAQAGALWGVFGRSSIWRCDTELAKWEEVGRLRPFLRQINHAVSTGSAAFVWSDDGGVFGWLDVLGNAYYPAAHHTLPEQVLAARPARGGVELMLQDGEWMPVAFPSPRAESQEAFASFNPWWIMAGVSGIGVILGMGTLVWRKRSGEEAVPLELPSAVRRNMELLAPHAGNQLEVQELDDALGFGVLETDETRRSRRSRTVNEINAWSQGVRDIDLVERQRDPLDRRRSIYLVRRELVELLAEAGKDLA